MEKDVIVVEKLEDINIMNGIDFRLNQRLQKIEEDQRRLKQKVRRKNKLQNTLLTITLILAMGITIMLAMMLWNDTDKSIDDCISKGYSRPYCEKTIIGG